MHHLGTKDVRRLGSTTAVAVLVPGHHRAVSETIVWFPCLEYKIPSVTTGTEEENCIFDMLM